MFVFLLYDVGKLLESRACFEWQQRGDQGASRQAPRSDRCPKPGFNGEFNDELDAEMISE
jgi:hypothetical protein